MEDVELPRHLLRNPVGHKNHFRPIVTLFRILLSRGCWLDITSLLVCAISRGLKVLGGGLASPTSVILSFASCLRVWRILFVPVNLAVFRNKTFFFDLTQVVFVTWLSGFIFLHVFWLAGPHPRAVVHESSIALHFAPALDPLAPVSESSKTVL